MNRVTFATEFKNHSFSFWRNAIFIGEHRFGWKPDGQIISLSNFGSARQSVLTCGTVSRDWPRDIVRIKGNLKSTDYLQILERASEEKLWAEIDQFWDDFIQKDDIVDAVTTGYLWIDLSNIAEEHS
ncbi:hypothetical protein DAPPUDRAFT_322560 [Daphnia pulex]|uniref:Uncharacterized protein n=1 Tax=Daphnia pulex TaxID=6669 RepID=E9GWD2_DAPPU|nr:hypothetical protein DAPPUDRAFT_322560 [Daphnia pulex]|eukprot:EFX76211.1 hypothetical protein DAPPUDRAFT_322560 [Daphnia pulex]